VLHEGSDHQIRHRDVQEDGRERDLGRSRDLLEGLANLQGEAQR